MTKYELLEHAKALPKDERIKFAMELWDTLDLQPEDLPPSEEEKRELDRRIAEYEADPEATEEWNSLRAKLLRREF